MMFRRAPYSEESIRQSAEAVVETLELHEFDKRDVVILGGGALACLGIRPANDVDIIVAPEVFDAARRSLTSPGGLELTAKHNTSRPWLTTYGTTSTSDASVPFELDLTPFYTPSHFDGDLNALFHDRFLNDTELYDGWHHLSTGHILYEIFNHRKWDRRARRDEKLIRAHSSE